MSNISSIPIIGTYKNPDVKHVVDSIVYFSRSHQRIRVHVSKLLFRNGLTGNIQAATGHRTPPSDPWTLLKLTSISLSFIEVDYLQKIIENVTFKSHRIKKMNR